MGPIIEGAEFTRWNFCLPASVNVVEDNLHGLAILEE
jgi:hypothetical protein